MSDPIDNVVKSRAVKFTTYGVWFVVIALSLASLLLSGIAYQRSKLDNDTMKNISKITARLERTAENLDRLARNSNTFNRDQSTYLHKGDQQLTGDYNALSQQHGEQPLTDDDGSAKWLFSQNHSERGQQSSGDQKPGIPN